MLPPCSPPQHTPAHVRPRVCQSVAPVSVGLEARVRILTCRALRELVPFPQVYSTQDWTLRLRGPGEAPAVNPSHLWNGACSLIGSCPVLAPPPPGMSSQCAFGMEGRGTQFPKMLAAKTQLPAPLKAAHPCHEPSPVRTLQSKMLYVETMKNYKEENETSPL